MADISKITLPQGTVYNIKDSWAREQIATLTGTAALAFRGVSSTSLTDNGVETPTVGGKTVQITDLGTGDIYFYQTGEYIWGADSKWHELGNLSGLGGLAYQNSASTSYTPEGGVIINITSSSSQAYGIKTTTGTTNYTPAGSITNATFIGTSANISMSTDYQPAGSISYSSNNPTITVSATSNSNGNYQPTGNISAPTINKVEGSGETTDINNPTGKVMAQELIVQAPGTTASTGVNYLTYYSVASENLSLYQFGYTSTISITSTTVTVKTGDASYIATAPTFTGTTVQIGASVTMPAATFSGTTTTINMGTVYTPAGTVEASFSGTGVRLVTDTITIPTEITGTFNGTSTTIEVS